MTTEQGELSGCELHAREAATNLPIQRSLLAFERLRHVQQDTAVSDGVRQRPNRCRDDQRATEHHLHCRDAVCLGVPGGVQPAMKEEKSKNKCLYK